jgi:hypothetical protein
VSNQIKLKIKKTENSQNQTQIFANICPDAQFLFNHLVNLRLAIPKGRRSVQEISRTVQCLESYTNHGRLNYLDIDFTNGLVPLHMIHPRVDAVTLNRVDLHYKDYWWLKIVAGAEFNSEVSELTVSNCQLETLDSVVFDLFPRLEKLDFSGNQIETVDEEMFKKAGNLRELDLSNQLKFTGSIPLTIEALSCLVNLTVLKLDKIKLKNSSDELGKDDENFSFEPFNCLVNLEELKLKIDKYAFTIDKFAQLAKLKKLVLWLDNVYWIAPSAFDHLERLDWLELRLVDSDSDYSFCKLEVFKTGLAPRHLDIFGPELVKLNSRCEAARVESMILGTKSNNGIFFETANWSKNARGG